MFLLCVDTMHFFSVLFFSMIANFHDLILYFLGFFHIELTVSHLQCCGIPRIGNWASRHGNSAHPFSLVPWQLPNFIIFSTCVHYSAIIQNKIYIVQASATDNPILTAVMPWDEYELSAVALLSLWATSLTPYHLHKCVPDTARDQ